MSPDTAIMQRNKKVLVNPASAKTYNPTKVQSSNISATSQYSTQDA
jgi:hypothetical protein